MSDAVPAPARSLAEANLALDQLRALVEQLAEQIGQLSSDLDDAVSRIGDVREYNETLNERRYHDVDRLQRQLRELRDDCDRTRYDHERAIAELRNGSRRW